MLEFILRNATTNDIPFLVDTIVEAEKAGTDRFPYSTIFGLTEEESRRYIADMLLEDVDGCELSISSYLIAESDKKPIAAVSAWIEGAEGIPSSIIKGNLLNYILPKSCIERATKLNEIVRDLNIDYILNTIQIGAGYVSKEYRGNNLLGILITEKTKRLHAVCPSISAVYDHMYDCNIPAIRTDEKLNFKVALVKESVNTDINKYLPSNKKMLMLKNI